MSEQFGFDFGGAAKAFALHHWIVVLSCAYMEYTYTPWNGRNHYRRTVDYGRVVWC